MKSNTTLLIRLAVSNWLVKPTQLSGVPYTYLSVKQGDGIRWPLKSLQALQATDP